jgi:hypothetical protein
MLAYILLFAMTVWPPRTQHRAREMRAIAEDIASTDASPLEGLKLMNIAAYESNFDTLAINHEGSGALGPFQIMPPAASYGADEALRRLRQQGIMGFMGCPTATDRCLRMAERRTWQARLWRMGYEPPVEDNEAAGNPYSWAKGAVTER